MTLLTSEGLLCHCGVMLVSAAQSCLLEWFVLCNRMSLCLLIKRRLKVVVRTLCCYCIGTKRYLWAFRS